MGVTNQDYEGGKNLIAGDNVSTLSSAPLAADTYYIGMLLEYNATNDELEAISTGTLAAIYNGDEDGRVLSASGVGSVIVAGDISEEGLVDNAGAALTLTEDQRWAYRDAGFYMKKN